MADFGGFEHNLHGLRIIDFLEYRYANFPGLNLSWEVLEAQARHSKRPDAPKFSPTWKRANPYWCRRSWTPPIVWPTTHTTSTTRCRWA